MVRYFVTLSVEDAFSEEYEKLIHDDIECLYYARRDYLEAIREIVNGDIIFFFAFKDEKMIGALPAIMKRGKWGMVMNSLPFFGSNPGIIISPSLSLGEQIEVRKELIKRYWEATEPFFSATLIERPFDKFSDIYVRQESKFLDNRVGMRTILPPDKEILDLYHSKTRNLVRKAQKMQIKIRKVEELGELQEIIEIHRRNMSAIGAPIKPELFMAFMRKKMTNKDSDMIVYKAEHPKDESVIAGLVLFIHNQTAEYFMPVIKEEYRSVAPLNLVIYEAMRDLQKKRIRYWNWGGTKLPEQYGVYHFKKRFGAEEMIYHYYTMASISTIRKGITVNDLSREYPYFYIIPYSYLPPPSQPADNFYGEDEE